MKAIVDNRLMRMIVVSLFFVSLIAGMQVAIAGMSTKANAADASCGGVGACLGTVAASVGSQDAGNVLGPPSAGPPAVGPGGVVAAPQPQSTSPDGKRTVDARKTRVTYSSGTICPQKQINGFTIKPVGLILVESQNVEWYFMNGMNGSRDGDWFASYGPWSKDYHVCLYPPDPVITGTNMNCILSYDAQVDRMANSRLGAAPGVGRSGETISSKASLEQGGLPNCKTQLTAGLAYNPPQGQPGWGQYQAYSRITQITCNFATTTFDGVATNVGKCGAPKTVKGTTSKLTVWCDGYSSGWLNKSWTGTDCINTVQTQLKCVIPNAATYNGYANNVQALRDGKNGLVKWGNPTLIGGWGDSNWVSSTFIKAGSSPRKAGIGDNDTNNQMFISDVPFSANASGFISGKRLDQNIAFYTAGDAGAPFKMERNYRFSAWSNTLQVSIRSINVRTGVVGTSSSLVAVQSHDNSCGPQASPNISVIRAIGDKIG